MSWGTRESTSPRTGKKRLSEAIESIPGHSKKVLVVTHGGEGVTVIEGAAGTEVPGIPVRAW